MAPEVVLWRNGEGGLTVDRVQSLASCRVPAALRKLSAAISYSPCTQRCTKRNTQLPAACYGSGALFLANLTYSAQSSEPIKRNQRQDRKGDLDRGSGE